MWAIGRNETCRQPAIGSPVARAMLSSTQHRFRWESITPFGGPVVPEV